MPVIECGQTRHKVGIGATGAAGDALCVFCRCDGFSLAVEPYQDLAEKK